MAESKGEHKLVKQVHPSRPDWDYYLLEPGMDAVDELLKPRAPETGCEKPCTTIIKLLPKTNVAGTRA